VSLVSVTEVKARIKTTLGDSDLQTVIDQVEAEVITSFGAYYVSGMPMVVEMLGGGLCNLYLRRRLASIGSIVDDGTTLTTNDYRLWASQGRIERLPAGTRWGVMVVVKYLPTDDSAKWRGVIIDLVRLTLERTAMKSESISEYSYTAPEWGAEEAVILRRLKMGL